MYGRTTYIDNRLFLNNQEVSGVIGFEAGMEIPLNYINVLGSYNGAEEKDGFDTKNVTITKYLIPNDPIRNFTGEAFCSGLLLYKNNNYSFNSGYLTSYSVSCSVGEISTVTSTFDVYGLIGGEILPTFYPEYQNITDLPVSHFGNIHITTDEGYTNRIVSFNLDIQCNRLPQFVLGSQYPLTVYLNRPLEINLSIEVEVDDYECNNIQTVLCGPKKNITLELKNCDNTNIMESFIINNARLISENINSDLSNPTTISLNYRSYLI
jgi:hypothetical protein